jgi:hypothetical protein
MDPNEVSLMKGRCGLMNHHVFRKIIETGYLLQQEPFFGEFPADLVHAMRYGLFHRIKKSQPFEFF